MIVKRIAIHQLGPHRGTDVDIPIGLTSVVGTNGKGKTMLVESIFAGLYGYYPKRGHLKKSIADGHEDGFLKLTFEIKGTEYRVERFVTQNSTEAWLYTPYKTIGPKVRGVDAYIESLVGSPSIALATWFSAQTRNGDLVVVEESKRREVLGELLKLEEYNTISRQAAERRKEANASASALNSEKIKAEIEAIEERLESGKVESLKLNEEINESNLWIAQIQPEILESKKALEEFRIENEGITRLLALKDELKRARAAREEIQTLSDSEARLEQLKQRLASAVNAINDNEKRQLLIHERDKKAYLIEKRLQPNLDEMVLMSDDDYSRTKSLAARFDSSEHSGLPKEIAAITKKIHAAERDEQSAESIISEIWNIGTLESPCERCAFVDLWNNKAEKLTQAKEKKEKALAIIDESMPILESLTARLQELDDARLAQDAQVTEETKRLSRQTTMDAINKLKAEIREMEIQIANLETAQSEDPKALQQEIEHQAKRLARHSVCSHLAENIPALESSINALSQYGENPQKHDLAILTAHIATVEGELKAAQEHLTQLKFKQGAAQANEQNLVTSKDKLEESLKNAQRYEADVKKFDTIAKAFGPKGIQPILIDSIAAPRIEAIASEYISEITGEQLKINTVRTLSNGEKAECFDILISQNGITWRDVSTFSGGEEALYRTCIRLAVLAFISERSGYTWQCLVFDEMFESISIERKKSLLSLLSKISKMFAQVMIVSHDDWFSPQMENQIYL